MEFKPKAHKQFSPIHAVFIAALMLHSVTNRYPYVTTSVAFAEGGDPEQKGETNSPLSAAPAHNTEKEKTPPVDQENPKRVGCGFFFGWLAVVTSPAWLSGGYFATDSHWFKAHRQGAFHVGNGIYLNMEEVKKRLTPEERALLSDPKKNRDAIVRLFTKKLSGDYDKHLARLPWHTVEDFQGRPATRFMEGESTLRGICRHKAPILSAILNEVGIKAETRCGWVDDHTERHAWTYLPETNEVADPTENWVGSNEKYQRWRKVEKEESFQPKNADYIQLNYKIIDE